MTPSITVLCVCFMEWGIYQNLLYTFYYITLKKSNFTRWNAVIFLFQCYLFFFYKGRKIIIFDEPSCFCFLLKRYCSILTIRKRNGNVSSITKYKSSCSEPIFPLLGNKLSDIIYLMALHLPYE